MTWQRSIFEADGEDEELLDDDEEWLDDDAVAISAGLFTVVHLWKTLGAIDPEDRLTDLGWWGLPESLLRAWQPSDDQK